MSLQLAIDAATLNQIAAHGADMAQHIGPANAHSNKKQQSQNGRAERAATLRILLSCQSVCSWKA